ncbi:MAG: hypothetical protein ACLFUV_02585 [Methanomassiliicoccales archaeon]
MKDWKIKLAVVLLVLSAVVYFIHWIIFRDVHHIFIYMIGDIGFAFMEVLLITILIHQVIERREKRERMEKMNMVIGAFFSEVGTNLLAFFSDMDPEEDRMSGELTMSKEWSDEQFEEALNRVKCKDFSIDVDRGDFKGLRRFLVEKRDFLVRLLENPNLLEHETFTETLWGVFHLMEEMSARDKIDSLPSSDLEHLKGDIERAYKRLIGEWVEYMKHLKDNYPYLFSLALRTNPFDPNAHPVISA